MSAGLGVLCIGQKVLNCLAVMLTLCSSNFCMFRERDSKHTSVITCYVVCLFVISSVSLKAAASPNWDGMAKLVDGRQVSWMTTESNLSEGVVGVFSEVKENVVEGKAIRGNSFAVPFYGRSSHGIEEPRDQYASSAKEPRSQVSKVVRVKPKASIGLAYSFCLYGLEWHCRQAEFLD